LFYAIYGLFDPNFQGAIFSDIFRLDSFHFLAFAIVRLFNAIQHTIPKFVDVIRTECCLIG